MGAVEGEGYVFEPEYSVINPKEAIHVYKDGSLIEEIKFEITGEAPMPQQVMQFIDLYCEKL